MAVVCRRVVVRLEVVNPVVNPAVLQADLLVTPWVVIPRVVIPLVAVRRAMLSPGCPRAEWDYPPAAWVIAATAPMVKLAKMAASPEVESAVEQVAISLARSANSPAVDKVQRNLVKNWISRLVISMRHSAKSSVRLLQ